MKKNRKIFMAGLLICALFTCACNLTNFASSILRNAATPTAQTSNVLFSDDFSDTSTGWDQGSSADGLTDYKDGTYRIRVETPNLYFWANPGRSYGNVSIEVDAAKVDGPEDNDFGLMCRYQDENNFYFARAASDGYYTIGKYAEGQLKFFLEDEWAITNVIKTGNSTNHLRLDCVGDKISFYINGNLMAEVSDDDFPTGDLGLIAGSYNTGGVEFAFDNFIVTRP